MLDTKAMGKAIRRTRKGQLLTIEKLAEQAGISENYLGKIERGEGMPSLQTIDRIARALNVSIDSLMGDPEYDTERMFINSLMEINELSEQKKEKFLDFIHTNLKYFK